MTSNSLTWRFATVCSKTRNEHPAVRSRLPALRQAPAARIVNVSSHAHTFVRDMGFEDMQAEKGYKTFREYGRSKLANILFTRSLAQRLEGQNITVNCLHPGAVATSLGTNNGVTGKVLTTLLKPFFRSPERGAATSPLPANAADARMAHVKRLQNGRHASVSQRLLNEIATATWVTDSPLSRTSPATGAASPAMTRVSRVLPA